MDNQEKTFLLSLGVGIALLLLFRPKGSFFSHKTDLGKTSKTALPKKADSKASETNHQGTIAIKAMRSALDDGISQEEALKLQNLILKEHKLRVVLEGNILKAKNQNGKIVAKENGNT